MAADNTHPLNRTSLLPSATRTGKAGSKKAKPETLQLVGTASHRQGTNSIRTAITNADSTRHFNCQFCNEAPLQNELSKNNAKTGPLYHFKPAQRHLRHEESGYNRSRQTPTDKPCPVTAARRPVQRKIPSSNAYPGSHHTEGSFSGSKTTNACPTGC